MVEELKKVGAVEQQEGPSKSSSTKQIGGNKSIWTTLREQMSMRGGRNDEQIKNELQDATDERAAYKMQLGQLSPFSSDYKHLTEVIQKLDAKVSTLSTELDESRANANLDPTQAIPKFNFET